MGPERSSDWTVFESVFDFVVANQIVGRASFRIVSRRTIHSQKDHSLLIFKITLESTQNLDVISQELGRRSHIFGGNLTYTLPRYNSEQRRCSLDYIDRQCLRGVIIQQCCA